MAEEQAEQARPARSAGASFASNVTFGGAAAYFLPSLAQMVGIELEPDALPFIVVGLVGAWSFIGSAARDSEFVNVDRYEQGSAKDFLMTLAARLIG